MKASDNGEREIKMLDIARPDHEVEVVILPSVGQPEHRTLWINVDGLCRLRITGITRDLLRLDIERYKS